MNSFDVSAFLRGDSVLQKCYVLLCSNSEQLKMQFGHISYICKLANLLLHVQENVQPVELENLKRVFKWSGTQMVSTAVSVQTSAQDPLCLCSCHGFVDPMQQSFEHNQFYTQCGLIFCARLDTKKDDRICWQETMLHLYKQLTYIERIWCVDITLCCLERFSWFPAVIHYVQN